MNRITLTEDREGLEGFPAACRPVGRDDLGDVLAVAEDGRVHCFAHGAGDWTSRTLAFESLERVAQYVHFREGFEIPEGADVATLKRLRDELEETKKSVRKSPYFAGELRAALDDVKERLADAKWAASKQGKSVLDRQAFGAECQELLRADGANAGLMVGASATSKKRVVVCGTFDPPWTEERIRELVTERADGRFDLDFQLKPAD